MKTITDFSPALASILDRCRVIDRANTRIGDRVFRSDGDVASRDATNADLVDMNFEVVQIVLAIGALSPGLHAAAMRVFDRGGD
jgi:hypothetical protein